MEENYLFVYGKIDQEIESVKRLENLLMEISNVDIINSDMKKEKDKNKIIRKKYKCLIGCFDGCLMCIDLLSKNQIYTKKILLYNPTEIPDKFDIKIDKNIKMVIYCDYGNNGAYEGLKCLNMFENYDKEIIISGNNENIISTKLIMQ